MYIYAKMGTIVDGLLIMPKQNERNSTQLTDVCYWEGMWTIRMKSNGTMDVSVKVFFKVQEQMDSQ